jgi:hypothetical protein
MKGAGNLAKFIIEQGYDKNGNGTDKRVLALLNSLARKPDNLRHRKLLWRIIGPEMIKRAFIGDPFMPYPTQDEFEGEIEVGVIGICEAFKLELKNAVTGNQAHIS